VNAPTLPAGHEQYEALAVAWAIDALEPSDQRRFEEHRTGCETCVDAAAGALHVAVELAYAVPYVAVPPTLRGRLLAAAALCPASRTGIPPHPPRPTTRCSR